MLYIHIPFCRHKCTYCAFYSVASRHGRDAYVDALCAELQMRSSRQPLRTLYMGGGTPTQLAPVQLDKLVRTLRDCFDLSHLEEATIEANPDDLTPDYLRALFDLHLFNRLSIGIQTFDDDELRLINRAHSCRQALHALDEAARVGFDNISVDLIMGLPHQTLESWVANLRHLEDCSYVRHLSCYELTVEPHSILERQLQTGRVGLPPEEFLLQAYDALLCWCADHDFQQYEVSNYCRPGWYSRHNSRYWDRTPYIGVGAAAHSFDGSCRRWNVADIGRYTAGALAGAVPYEEECLSATDAFNEYVMTSLRTVRGIERAHVAPHYWSHLMRAAVPYVREGLLRATPSALLPTASGLLHADGIAAGLFM